MRQTLAPPKTPKASDRFRLRHLKKRQTLAALYYVCSYNMKRFLIYISLLLPFIAAAQQKSSPDTIPISKDTVIIGHRYNNQPVTPSDTVIVASANSKKVRYWPHTTRITAAMLQQPDSSGNTRINYRKRRWLIGGINAAGYGGSLIALSSAWYKNFPKSRLKSFDDSKEWLQTDKIGHAWTAYNTGRASAAMWRWAGLSQRKAAWVGGLSGAAYLTVIEFLDGHSANWGWSWADMGANVGGSGLFIGQELLWREQRVVFKFSFHQKSYDDAALNARTNQLFGKSWYERMLKDYNGQTYWLSANLHSFFPKSKLPRWLNVAAGYGAENLFGGFENIAKDVNGNTTFNRSDLPRYRQWYIAPDIDLSKIKTRHKGIRILLDALNIFKFPAPSVGFSRKGISFNWLHF
jgi:hypothetical protein